MSSDFEKFEFSVSLVRPALSSQRFPDRVSLRMPGRWYEYICPRNHFRGILAGFANRQYHHGFFYNVRIRGGMC